MTNEERLAFLTDMNLHLSNGGEIEHFNHGHWHTTIGDGPSWTSNPSRFRKKVVPRVEQITVYYYWDDRGCFTCSLNPFTSVPLGCIEKQYIKTIICKEEN